MSRADREFIAQCGARCELALRCESAALAYGCLLDAADFAEEAERLSAYAFAVATW